ARERWRGVARTSVSLWFTLMPPALTCVLTVRLGAGPVARTRVSLWLLAMRPTLTRGFTCIHCPPACLVGVARSVRLLPSPLLSPCGGGQRRGEGTPHTHPGLPHWRGRAPGPWRCPVLLQVPCQPGRCAVGGGQAPRGVGPRGAARLGGRGAHTPRAGAGQEPVGARPAAPGTCILSDTGCIPVG